MCNNSINRRGSDFSLNLGTQTIDLCQLRWISSQALFIKIVFFLLSAVITDLSSSAGDFMSKGPPPALLFGLR
jgi:hypothetical protein